MITRECDVETIADFARYYSSSFVGWHGRDAGKIIPAFVGRLDGDSVQFRFVTQDEVGSLTFKESEQHTFKNIKEHIDFGRPRLGILEDGPTIVFLSQTTPREPRKGLRLREARIHEFNGWDTRSILVKANPYNERLDWVWRAFNPEFTPFQSSFKKLSSGDRIGAALTTDLGLFTLPKIMYPLVAVKRWTVGYARSEELIILHPAFADYKDEIHKITGVEVNVS